MQKLSKTIIVLSVCAMATSCVTKQKYSTLNNQYLQAQAQLNEAKATMFALNEKMESSQKETKAITETLKVEAAKTQKENNDKDVIIAALRNQIKVLESRIYTLQQTKTPQQIQIEKKQKNSY